MLSKPKWIVLCFVLASSVSAMQNDGYISLDDKEKLRFTEVERVEIGGFPMPVQMFVLDKKNVSISAFEFPTELRDLLYGFVKEGVLHVELNPYIQFGCMNAYYNVSNDLDTGSKMCSKYQEYVKSLGELFSEEQLKFFSNDIKEKHGEYLYMGGRNWSEYPVRIKIPKELHNSWSKKK